MCDATTLPVLVSLETGICVPEASSSFHMPSANAEPVANAESSKAAENFLKQFHFFTPKKDEDSHNIFHKTYYQM